MEERRGLMTWLDRLTLSMAPRWTLQRLRARAAASILARHYEAAQPGRRTSGWARRRGDANAVGGVALAELRMHARDLIRNNGWAKRAQRVISNNTVGWGIYPRASGAQAARAMELWKKWAESPNCEAGGRHTFYGIQALAMRSAPESGEVLIRKRPRRKEDGLAIPLQLQVLEADFLDTSMDSATSLAGGPIIQGVEFDLLGRRAAYWLFPEHPGSLRSSGISKRIPASEILHVYLMERPGQVRGVSWFGASIVPLKDLDEFEDASLVRQKIAACFAAFVEDPDGTGAPIGDPGKAPKDELVETFEPGMIARLPAGKKITFATPPTIVDERFDKQKLLKVAAALGVPYEEMTGDYSATNYSSSRMSRLAHWGHVRSWQWEMLIPQLCGGVWGWAMEAAALAGLLDDGQESPGADWTTPPMPMLEPDKEGLAYQRLVRNGVMTLYDVIREQGGDPATHLQEYAEANATLDKLKIMLDSDPRAVSAAGLTQAHAGATPATQGAQEGESSASP